MVRGSCFCRRLFHSGRCSVSRYYACGGSGCVSFWGWDTGDLRRNSAQIWQVDGARRYLLARVYSPRRCRGDGWMGNSGHQGTATDSSAGAPEGPMPMMRQSLRMSTGQRRPRARRGQQPRGPPPWPLHPLGSCRGHQRRHRDSRPVHRSQHRPGHVSFLGHPSCLGHDWCHGHASGHRHSPRFRNALCSPTLGAAKWIFATQGSVASSPVVADGTVYV